MATVTMPSVDQEEEPPADDHGDGIPQAENEERSPQGMANPFLAAEFHECHVEMIAVDDIYVTRNGQHDALVNALVDSIAHIGLQNPICVVRNDIAGNAATYRIVSGRKRLAAFVKLGRSQIPAHILTFPPEDQHQDARKQLAEYEENIVRNHLSLLELCEHLGQCKNVYETLYPETKHGKAPKHTTKDLGTRPLPYILNAERKLGKSRATIGKLLHIYRALIETQQVEPLQAIEHPILHRVEDLAALASSKDDIPELVKILVQDSNTTVGTFCSLQDAQQQLQRRKDAEALQKAQEATPHQQAQHAHTTSSQDSGTDSPAMSAPQPCDVTTLPSADEALVSTQHDETPAGMDTAADEVCATIDDVLLELDEHITTYVDGVGKNRCARFVIKKHKVGNELHILVAERA